MMMTVIHIGILKKNNNAGTFLRIGYTAILILVMTFSSKVDSGDYLVCTVGLIYGRLDGAQRALNPLNFIGDSTRETLAHPAGATRESSGRRCARRS